MSELAKQLLLKKRKFLEVKQQVGALAIAVTSHPERNYLKLKSLLTLLDTKEDDESFKLAFTQIHTLVAYSLLEVFKDILPAYRVKENLEERADNKGKKVQLRKQTKELQEYEAHLIKYYKIFIHRMERMIDCIKAPNKRKSAFYDGLLETRRSRERIALVGAKCLCNMIVANPHFNLRDQVINIIAPLLANKNEDISRLCCDTFVALFKQDKLGEMSLTVVKACSKVIKAVGLRTQPHVLEVFLGLSIKEVKKKDDTPKDMKLVRGKLEKMSRKEKKRNKKMLKLDNQLLETEAQESYKKRLDFNTEILSQLFFIYFRLLKLVCEKGVNEEHRESTQCLSPVLEGLSKFCHLINVDFYDDLVALLYKLLTSDELTNAQTLCCLHTVFTILSDDGYALNIDPQRFYAQLYQCLLNLDTALDDSEDHTRLLQTCIDKMIIKRRKQMSTARALAFAKRLATVSMQCPTTDSASLLSSLRCIAQNHKQCDQMVDVETAGSGVFMPELTDPEYCNANATKLWELHVLRNHCDPLTRRFASYLLHSMQSNDLNVEILKQSPVDILQMVQEYNDEFVSEQSQLPPLSGKRKLHGYLFSAESLYTQEWKKIKL